MSEKITPKHISPACTVCGAPASYYVVHKDTATQVPACVLHISQVWPGKERADIVMTYSDICVACGAYVYEGQGHLCNLCKKEVTVDDRQARPICSYCGKPATIAFRSEGALPKYFCDAHFSINKIEVEEDTDPQDITLSINPVCMECGMPFHDTDGEYLTCERCRREAYERGRKA